MKNLICLVLVSMGTGCVMTPTGDIYSAPVDVEAEVGVGGGFGPRVHLGSRSAVTVWLHPNFHVYDAYPIAQRHCSRWGFFARPQYDWSISAGEARYLDYTCVRRRPHIAYPHFRRNHYRNRYNNRRRVITPKPRPRVERPVRRRGTFGRVFNPRAPRKRTVVERGKSWEHNRGKGGVVTGPRGKKSTVERGKAWEHNSNKGGINDRRTRSRSLQKRSTFGSGRPKIRQERRATKNNSRSFGRSQRSFGGLKSKKGPSRRGTLSL